MGELARKLIAYVLSRGGCMHPFRLSRILALLDIKWFEKTGSTLTGLEYVMGPGTFFIEGIKEMIESDECFEKREGDPTKGIRGCILYRCETPEIPEDIREILDGILEEVEGLDDMELNRRVIENPLFKKIAKPLS